MQKNIANLKKLNKKVKKILFGFRDFEGAYIINNLVGDKKKILVVGCTWGRDYHFMTSMGRDVTNLDLGKQDVPNVVVGDISKRTPFKDNEFDAVIMGEIIEHVFEDTTALREVRRILKDDGRLILTIAYFDDKPDYHVRIHSRRTIIRLFENCGFKPIREISRGGLISFSKIFALPSLFLSLFNESLRIKYLMFISNLDIRLGNLNHNVFRFAKSYGGYFLVVKDKNKDFVGINRNTFTGG